jgi:hypothetical protein
MGLKDTYSAADLEGLTPEELSALENEAGDEDGVIAEIAASGDEGAEAAAAAAKTAEGAAAEGAEGAQADAGAGKDGAAAAAGPAASAPAAEGAAAPQPVTYHADAGDVAKDVQTQKDAIKAARAEKSEALQKLNDGEIEFEEYAKVEAAADGKIDAAQDKILEINRAATRAEVASELTQQQQVKAWNGMVSGYMADAKAKDGLDFAGDAGKPLREELNGLVRAFAQEAVHGQKLSDDEGMAASRWALEQAAAVMRMRHPKAAAAAPAAGGAAAPAAAPAAAAPAVAAAAGTAGAAAPRHNVTTLGGMPNAAPAQLQDDTLSKLGALSGEDLEIAMAKLSPSEMDRVLAST